jgi:hypothetical protein
MNERQIFTDALAMPQPERGGYLDEACGADPALRERLEQLLVMHENGQSLLEKRPAEMLAAMSDKNDGTETELTSEEASARQLAIFLAPSARPDALGRLAHYEVLQVLGQGAFGIVVKAFDESLHRVVAIKVLAPHLAVTSPPRKRFLREARAAAQVRHEHVVQIYAVEEKPLPYLVMEFIEGQTLQQKLDATGPLDPPEAVRLGQQVAMGLAAAHEQGLIHRDVTPANILLPSGPTPCVKLTDFGLARTSDDASQTASGVIAGTPMYMSPEQARGVQLDHRADLFSLGSVLYTVTTGHPPFRAATTLDVLRRVVEDTPRPIRQVMEGVPPGLCAVIDRLLEKDPKDRFATARDAADALGRSLTDGHRVARHDRFRRRVWQGAALVAAALFVFATAAWLAGGHAASRQLARSLNEPPLTAGGKPDGENNMPQNATSEVPSGFTVTSVLDDDSDGTLRWAIREANLHPGEDRITFDQEVFASPQTITLSQGPLMLTDPAMTTIRGPAGGLTLSGNHKSQVFVIGAWNEVPTHAAQASIADLTIAHGQTTDEFTIGGGVEVMGGSTLTLTGCTLRDNKANASRQQGDLPQRRWWRRV